MTVFARFILGGDEARRASAAGWGLADILWERSQERAHRHHRAGRRGRALLRWRLAHRVARLSFGGRDPRLATSLANVGLALREAGRARRARRCYARALEIWGHVGEAIDAVSIREAPLSSLHHMRMQARHRETYRENAKARLRRFAEEARETIEAGAAGRAPARDLFGRWAGEKPAGFDGRRRVLSACLLLAGAPDPAAGQDRSAPAGPPGI